MAQYRFRPLQGLEERATPASLWELGVRNAKANEGLVRQVADYLVATNQATQSFNPAYIDPATRDYLNTVVQQSQAGADKVRELRYAALGKVKANPALLGAYAAQLKTLGGLEYQLRGIVAVARRVGAIVGTDFTPTTPTTPAGPTDEGMVNTIPNINSPKFIDQGNGLKLWDTRLGTGKLVAVGAEIEIFYTGWLLNGTRFDSNRSPKPPAELDLDTLIEGWKQGIPGMRVGGIRRLYIPAALAYGEAGRPADPNNPNSVAIPPNSDLVFEIKVVGTTP